MKKLRSIFALVLILCISLSGCFTPTTPTDPTTPSVAATGDLEYYASLESDEREELCEGNHIQVSGPVSYAGSSLIYIGSSLDDGVTFICYLSDSHASDTVEEGDYITIHGDCTSCLSSVVSLRECEIIEHTDADDLTVESTADPSSEPVPEPTDSVTESTAEVTTEATEPVHEHDFSAATCTDPKTCAACGATEGEPAGHNWISATCVAPKRCTACDQTEGSATGHDWKSATCTTPKTCYSCEKTEGSISSHSYSDGSCSFCGRNDPNYSSGTLVWIPTNGGKKYHTHAGCSNMKDPEQVTQSRAEALGFTPCKRCH